MRIIQSYLTENPCYKTNKKITPKGIMIHSVGCSQPSAQVFIKQWNKSTYDRACVHAFIDGNSGDVYQTLPWNHRGWHCGNSGNNTHIGIEMCEPAMITYTSGTTFTIQDTNSVIACVKRTYESAVELAAKLCKEYNLNPLHENVIVSHNEGYQLGIASNHGDPEHLWKGCNLNYTMNTFRGDVFKKLNNSTTSSLKVGMGVYVKEGAKTYDGVSLASFVYKRIHKVHSIKEDRVVITYNSVVIAAIHKDDLILA